jgi:hypothetical protein
MKKIHCCGEKHRSGFRVVFYVLAGIASAVFFAAIFAIVVKYLWNWLMVDLFSLPVIGYLQAFGLVLLARLLIGGWHHGHHHGHHGFHHFKKHKSLHEIFRNKDEFVEFWESEGREAFEKYLQKK